jgi:flagellar biosynthesis GTPase FlhF
MTKIQTLSIDLLRLDGDTQARIKIHEDTVDDYEALIESEGEWPFEPIDVFHDGSEYFVADGFHRTLAAIRLKRASIECRVHNGTAKDARIFGMTANDLHGLRMSREDKRACVEWLLDNGGQLTQAEIAAKAGVGERTVKRIVAERKEESVKGPMAPSSRTSEGTSSTSTKSDPAAKDKKKAEAAAAKEKAKADKAAAAEKAKAEKAVEREKKKADAAAAKEKAKADAKAAREKAKDDAKAVKMAALPIPEQVSHIKSMIQQHLGKMVRLLDDLNRVKPNRAALNANLKACEGIKLW